MDLTNNSCNPSILTWLGDWETRKLSCIIPQEVHAGPGGAGLQWVQWHVIMLQDTRQSELVRSLSSSPSPSCLVSASYINCQPHHLLQFGKIFCPRKFPSCLSQQAGWDHPLVCWCLKGIFLSFQFYLSCARCRPGSQNKFSLNTSHCCGCHQPPDMESTPPTLSLGSGHHHFFILSHSLTG